MKIAPRSDVEFQTLVRKFLDWSGVPMFRLSQELYGSDRVLGRLMDGTTHIRLGDCGAFIAHAEKKGFKIE